MKLFIVSVLVAVASAKPSGVFTPLALSSPVAVAAPVAISSPVSTQYHSQDELGQYSYGYSNAHSAKSEARSINGLTVGGYTYVDPEGKLQTVEYSSDNNGFRVAASNLPVAPAVPVVPALPTPIPVQDTPEVAEARAKHLEALEVAKVRAAEIVAPVSTVTTTLVQPFAPLVAAAPLLAGAPLTAPLPAVIRAAAESAQPSAPLSTEAPTTAAPAEPLSTLPPTAEAKSALPKSAGLALATPAGVSLLATPAVGVKSIITPGYSVGLTPIVSSPTAYSINAIHPYGFSSIVAHPVATTYTAQFLAPAGIVQTGEAWSQPKEAEQNKE